MTLSVALTCVGGQLPAHADPAGSAGPDNADFETGDLSGWQVVAGDAFSVTDATTYWGGAFNKHGTRFLSGFVSKGDDATGEVRSSTFRLDSATMSFLVSGGWNPDRLYVALVRASDGEVLAKQSGMDDEALVRVTWDTSAWRGQDVYLRIVDNATGGWGHINADDFRVTDATKADNGLTFNRLSQQGQPAKAAPGAADYATDPLRPQFHYTPYQGWINDPNGLIQWNGRHQLFSQFYPDAPKWGPMHWAHADSSDGVHWRNLPVALAPPAPASATDASGIFSGSAVDDHGTLTAVYTISTDTGAHPGATPETVGIATSRDGVTFTPYTGNPVIAAPPDGSEAGFRDPYVFRDPSDGLWKLVIGSGHGGHGRAQLYSSKDLRAWTYVGVLAEGDGTTGAMWECPNLFQLGGKWVLLVSADNTDYAYVGTFDGKRFTPEKVSRLDAGPDLYAAQHYRDAGGRDLLIGWMDNWNAKEPTRVDGWAGAQTITRQLFLKPDGTVGSRPIAQADRLHTGAPRTTPAGQVTAPKELARGDALDLRATVDVGRSKASGFTLKLRSSAAEGAELRYDLATHVLTLDTTNAGYGSGGTWSATVLPDQAGRLDLRVLVDRSSLEVFTADGTALTARVYPRYQESDQVTLVPSGGAVQLTQARAWPMGSTWNG
ncbi:glycoside hydrolase family 32 protein [Actinomadura napierensis]|uniref:glycoside hydrolase family 32 protein n=1 Tax=Actinomadura napierensis TaxID=267854 RepID=UPI0031E43A96